MEIEFYEVMDALETEFNDDIEDPVDYQNQLLELDRVLLGLPMRNFEEE